MSLRVGLEISKALVSEALPVPLPLPLPLPLLPPQHPTMIIMNSPSETVSKRPTESFLLKLALVMVSRHSNRTVTKTVGEIACVV